MHPLKIASCLADFALLWNLETILWSSSVVIEANYLICLFWYQCYFLSARCYG